MKRPTMPCSTIPRSMHVWLKMNLMVYRHEEMPDSNHEPMHKKQRSIYSRMRGLGNQKPADDAGCAEAIKERDKCNLELKQLEQHYHQKMLQVVSASKLYDVIKAETHFYRRMMKGWQAKSGRKKDKRR